MAVILAALAAACTGNQLNANGLASPSTSAPRRPATSAPPTGPSTTVPDTPTTTPPSSGSSAAEPADNGFPKDWAAPQLSWKACAKQPSFECTTLRVPLDWSNPSGETIDLALARLPASGKRIGALVANPGGPGASGLDFVFSEPFKAELENRFDLVSWDPRGVGASTHLACGSRVAPFLHLDSDPDNSAEQSALDSAAQAVAAECAATDAKLLPHLGTDDTARDLEAIRIALAEPKLNYYGFSYGTYIGERYLALFPTHVRALVLDGVVNPTQGLVGLLTGQTRSMTAAIGRAFDQCKNSGSCPVADPAAAYDQVKSTVERSPLPTGGSRPLGPSELATGAIYATYDPQLWSSLDKAVAQAAKGKGKAMSDLADGYYDFGDWTAYADITCIDSAHPQGQADYQKFVESLRAISPDFGGPIGNEMLPCAYWPTPTQAHTGPIAAAASPDILVVGNTGDAATPYDDAVAVSKMLAHGHLLTYRGEGHTAYGRDDCTDAAIHKYLIDLTVPDPEPRCDGGAASSL